MSIIGGAKYRTAKQISVKKVDKKIQRAFEAYERANRGNPWTPAVEAAFLASREPSNQESLAAGGHHTVDDRLGDGSDQNWSIQHWQRTQRRIDRLEAALKAS